METINKAIQNMTNTAKLDLICEVCGEHKYTRYKNFVIPTTCECDRKRIEEGKKRDEEDKKRQRQYRLDRLIENSMMDEQFKSCTFENYKVDKYNKKIYQLAKRYCEKWPEMLKNNIGLMFYGKQGIGKSYASFCIANYLLERFIPVVAVSSIALLERFKKNYNSYGNDGEYEILNQLKQADLLILDDLGAENDTNWVKEKLYEIIDTRDRQNKPLIITTNLTTQQLQEKLTGKDGVNRTYDRIVKMCQPIEVVGKSHRIEEAKRKNELLKELLQGD